MLELRGICKTWQPRRDEVRQLLCNVNITLRAGQTVAVLGPSGSGKSTLLKIVAGLEPLDAGAVLFDGHDITQLPPERRHFALMFQDFALFPHLNVQDNVAFGLVEQRVAKADARTQALAMLERFGMQSFAKSRVWQLSGGEQQRVALARALITRPRVLLLDEPFSALDAALRVQLREEFRTHIAQHQMAVLWVTHDEAEARAMGDVGLRLDAGALRTVWTSPTTTQDARTHSV
jgi:ABC-type Fe3+/spermidine/putrescine transport system ATPase subunit